MDTLCSCCEETLEPGQTGCAGCQWQREHWEREQRAARLHYRTFRSQLRRTRNRRLAWHRAGLVARAVMEGRLSTTPG